MRGGSRTGAGRKPGSTSAKTVERLKKVAEVMAVVNETLPDAFRGDAHAFLVAVYKDPGNPLKARLDAATAAIGYEKPKLASIEHKGDGENPLELVTRVELVPVEPHRSSH